MYIYIHGRFSLFYINFLTSFQFSFISCSSTKSMKPNGNINTKWAIVLYFAWEKVLFYTKVKVFLLQERFRKRFSNFRSNKPNNATVCESLMLKNISIFGESISQSCISVKTRFSQFLRCFHVLVCLVYSS